MRVSCSPDMSRCQCKSRGQSTSPFPFPSPSFPSHSSTLPFPLQTSLSSKRLVHKSFRGLTGPSCCGRRLPGLRTPPPLAIHIQGCGNITQRGILLRPIFLRLFLSPNPRPKKIYIPINVRSTAGYHSFIYNRFPPKSLFGRLMFRCQMANHLK